MNDTSEPILECIACGNDDLSPVLDLGNQPLANSYKKKPDDPEDVFPLKLVKCSLCHHMQLSTRVNPDLLFKNYLYVSGTAPSQHKYMEWFAGFAIEKHGKDPVNVLDIGCNDGTQLDYFAKNKLETYGVDPAENLLEISQKKHHVIGGYFNGTEFPGVLDGFDIVVCQNAFAHNFNQLELLINIKKVLKKDGLFFATVSQRNMVFNGEFDTIYHEHLSFYNILSMSKLCERAGLNLIDVVEHPIHGGSYIFVVSREKTSPFHLRNLLNEEEKRGIYNEDTYKVFAEKAERAVENFRSHIKNLKEHNIPVIGYGAAAKGNVFLNYAGIGPDFIIDDNKLKQGTFSPGLGIEIAPIELLDIYIYNDSIAFVPLAWNFFDDIVTKIQDVRPTISYDDQYIRILPYFAREGADILD
jgi:SAM-dependent methyltransferase